MERTSSNNFMYIKIKIGTKDNLKRPKIKPYEVKED